MNLSLNLDGTQDDLVYGKLVEDGSFARELTQILLKNCLTLYVSKSLVASLWFSKQFRIKLQPCFKHLRLGHQWNDYIPINAEVEW